jgi:hypothetical protein
LSIFPEEKLTELFNFIFSPIGILEADAFKIIGFHDPADSDPFGHFFAPRWAYRVCCVFLTMGLVFYFYEPIIERVKRELRSEPLMRSE